MSGAGGTRRVLLVEDEYLIAFDMAHELTRLGLEVVGPFPTVAEAMAAVETGEKLDSAILDINLGGEMAWPLADALIARGVPILFATGYNDDIIPDRYAGVPRHGKPVTGPVLRRALDESASA